MLSFEFWSKPRNQERSNSELVCEPGLRDSEQPTPQPWKNTNCDDLASKLGAPNNSRHDQVDRCVVEFRRKATVVKVQSGEFSKLRPCVWRILESQS